MIKKEFLLAAVLFLLPFAVSSAGPNLIQNPTMQGSAPSPSGWTPVYWGDASSAVFTFPSLDTGISSGNAAKIEISNYGGGNGGGSAEWYFNPVPISGGGSYIFSNEYNSTVETQLVAQYGVPQNTSTCSPSQEGANYYCYFFLKSLPSTSGQWQASLASFSAPADATTISVLHIIYGNGSLSAGNYSLTEDVLQSYSQGMVSLTFDDGWLSQYTNAFPVLQNAGLKGSFYIISNAMLEADNSPNIMCNDPAVEHCNGAEISFTQNSWMAEYQWPDPVERSYVFNQTYTADAPVTLKINFYNATTGRLISATSTPASVVLPAASIPQTVSVPVKIKKNINLNNTYFSFVESLPEGGNLTVSNPSLHVQVTSQDTYMNSSQVKALQDAGHEIGLHTMDHCALAMLDQDPNSATYGIYPTGACASVLSGPSTAEQQISGSQQALAAAGFAANTIVYPYGDYNASVENISKNNGLIGGRTVLPGYNTKSTNPYALYTQIIDLNATNAGIANIKKMIDTAVKNKQWLIFTFHNVSPKATLAKNGDEGGTTPAFLKSIANYLKNKNVKVVTLQEGLQAQ